MTTHDIGAQLREEWGAKVPSHILDGLARYVEDGIPPGDFVRACLENNLYEAVFRADPVSYAHLREILKCIYNGLPAGIWGSRPAVKVWIINQRKHPTTKPTTEG